MKLNRGEVMIIGITGGSGSGKSSLAGLMQSEDALLIDADIIAREVVEKGMPALLEIVNTFGEDILMPDGSLNRKKLGAIVFGDKQRLLLLNQITHKYITERILDIINTKGYKSYIIDAAILIESEMYKSCDVVVVVTADEKVRINRIMERDGLSKTEAAKRVASQTAQEELIKKADYVIENNEDLKCLKAYADSLRLSLNI